MPAIISVVPPMPSTDTRSPLRVAVAMDKFKGTLSARQACEAVCDGLTRAFSGWPELRVAWLPMADGGDGTAEVLAEVGFTGAAIDMARHCGLAGRDTATLNPDNEDTSAVGREVMRLFRGDEKEITVALGGTRTIDGGAGFLQALGFTLTDADGLPVAGQLNGASLRRVASIHPPAGSLPRITMLADVTAPLVGPDGAVRSYGPQKGLTPGRFGAYERGLLHWAHLTGADASVAGAAGGMPCAAAVLRSYGCSVISGGAYVAAVVVPELINRLGGVPDLWITGEGRSDLQTLQGKAPYALLQGARRVQENPRVVLLSGAVTDTDALAQAGFSLILPINPPGEPLAACLDTAVARMRLTAAARHLADV